MMLDRIAYALAFLAVGCLTACTTDSGAPTGAGGGINVPSAGAGKTSAAEYRRITVQPGQSLGRIAQQYRVSTQAIVAANHLTPPYTLKAGATLVIPTSAAGPPPRPATVARPAVQGPHAVAASAPAPSKRKTAAEVIPLDEPSPVAGNPSNATHRSVGPRAAAVTRPSPGGPPPAQKIQLDGPPATIR